MRDALGAAIPGAGVGCAIARGSLAQLARASQGKPFAEESLTEDYELGLKIAQAGGKGRFLRVRTAEGRLVATRAFFPAQLDQAVRQKTRWMHGIALQGWDRLGWGRQPVDLWMQLRDRRGPLAAILLVIAYVLVCMIAVRLVLEQIGIAQAPPASPLLQALLWLNLTGLMLRFMVRFCCTAREYGWRQGVLAIPRTFVSNLPFAGAPGTDSTTLDLELPAYSLLNFSAGVDFDSGLSVIVYANNVLDENPLLSFDRERGGRARLGFQVGQPRTFGMTVRKSF